MESSHNDISRHCTRHEGISANGGIAPPILNFGNGRDSVNFMLQSFCHYRKRPWYPLNKKVIRPSEGRGEKCVVVALNLATRYNDCAGIEQTGSYKSFGGLHSLHLQGSNKTSWEND